MREFIREFAKILRERVESNVGRKIDIVAVLYIIAAFLYTVFVGLLINGLSDLLKKDPASDLANNQTKVQQKHSIVVENLSTNKTWPIEVPALDIDPDRPVNLRDIHFGFWWPVDEPKLALPGAVGDKEAEKRARSASGACGPLTAYLKDYANGRFSAEAKDKLAMRTSQKATLVQHPFYWRSGRILEREVSISSAGNTDQKTCAIAAKAIDSTDEHCIYAYSRMGMSGYKNISGTAQNIDENSISCSCQKTSSNGALQCSVSIEYLCVFKADKELILENCGT